jgi:hypothetical protein
MVPGTRTLACGSDADGAEINFIDHSGLIVSCTTREADPLGDGGSFTAVNSGDQEHLLLTWPMGDACAIGPADIEFWGPLTHAEEYMNQFLPNYVLRVARLDTVSCTGTARTQSVELVLSSPVFANDVEGFVSDLSSNGNSNFTNVTASTDSGTFELMLGGGSWDWVAGEPIDVSAYLLYQGPNDKVTLSGLVIPTLGFEQLDGTLEVPPPPTILMCPAIDHVLRRGVAAKTDFRVFESAGNEQYSAYFDQYAYDEHFRLPAGTYRLYAGVQFSVGSSCQGESVQLRTSIVIHVR